MSKAAPDRLALHLVHGLGLAALVVGLAAVGDTPIGADPSAALEGIGGQLRETLPAAVRVGLAAALNLAAGAVLMRLLVGVPLPGVAVAALAGLGGAVALDVVALATLGSVGLFGWPALLALNVGVIVVGAAALRRRGPAALLAHRPRLAPGPSWPLYWALVALVWSGPIVVQLASPVVPFLDVLPNHVAPVEHLRAFGGLAALDTTPSPIYGPSRIFLGYQALAGTATTLVDVPATIGVAAFALPVLLLVAAAGHGLAGTVGGPVAARWALLLVPLSVTFLRLADARAGVVAFPLAALALYLLVQPIGADGRRQAGMLAATLAAAILVHPLIGLLTAVSVAFLALLRPRADGWALSAVVAAPVACVGQWLAMLDVAAPPWLALLGLPAAGLVLVVAWRVGVDTRAKPVADVAARALPRLLVGGVVVGAAIGAVLAPAGPAALVAGVGGVVEWYAALLLAAALALAFARHLAGWHVPWAPVVVSALAGAAVSVVPTGSLIGDSLRFELPKTLTYFGPTFLAVAGAVGVAALWGARARPLAARAGLAALVLVVAAAPLRAGVVHELSLGEHRLSESLSISLRNAATGYWRGYPDPRRLIDSEQAEIVAALRAEVAAGRLTGSSRVLHVAASFQPWASIPVAAFTGAIETTATVDAERSIHTAGGRLEDFADLGRLLDSAFDYVVLEPAGLPRDVTPEVTAAGFTPLLSNDRGSVFSRPFLERLVGAAARRR